MVHDELLSLASECEKNVLDEKVKNLQKEEEACCRLKQRVQELQTQISDTQLLLDKENAKYQSACRQQEVSTTGNAIICCFQ